MKKKLKNLRNKLKRITAGNDPLSGIVLYPTILDTFSEESKAEFSRKMFELKGNIRKIKELDKKVKDHNKQR